MSTAQEVDSVKHAAKPWLNAHMGCSSSGTSSSLHSYQEETSSLHLQCARPFVSKTAPVNGVVFIAADYSFFIEHVKRKLNVSGSSLFFILNFSLFYYTYFPQVSNGGWECGARMKLNC